MIWVDADACPNVIKDILIKAAQKRKVTISFVANHYLRLPPSPFIRNIQVEAGFDIADDHIVQQAKASDLVITSDIPLADEAIAIGCEVLSPRGETLTADSIKPRLNLRDFNETLRASGIQSKGPDPLGQRERQQFANALDRYLTLQKK